MDIFYVSLEFIKKHSTKKPSLMFKCERADDPLAAQWLQEHVEINNVKAIIHHGT